MRIQYFESEETMGQQAAELVLQEVKRKTNALLCTATGSSPKPLYRHLAKHDKFFANARIIPLDEWIGLSSTEGSCHSYINEYILQPLKIPIARYLSFNVNVKSLERECKRVQEWLNREGPIDLCILGLGKNGHLGFNEPADELQPHCHIANLTPESQGHHMISGAESKPAQGLTLGIQDILAAKKIILLVSGAHKKDATEQLLSGKITTNCPATWLWKHDNVDCLILKGKTKKYVQQF